MKTLKKLSLFVVLTLATQVYGQEMTQFVYEQNNNHPLKESKSEGSTFRKKIVPELELIQPTSETPKALEGTYEILNEGSIVLSELELQMIEINRSSYYHVVTIINEKGIIIYPKERLTEADNNAETN